MHFWVAVGSSPAVLRIPSVAAMTVAVALVAVLTRRLTGSGWAGLFAGLVMALTPMISFYAQTARSYAMVLACVVAATLVLVVLIAIMYLFINLIIDVLYVVIDPRVKAT